MAKDELVSIVIVNHNYAQFLPQAINSALRQTYPRLEVIVVDDGSTDDSRQVISQYGSSVRAVFKSNGGQASAINAGFTASHGTLLIFLDADDLLLPHAVERIIDSWNPGVSKVQWALAHVDENLSLLGTTVPYDPQMMPSGDLRSFVIETARYVAMPSSGSAFSRYFLEKVMPISEAFWYQGAETPLWLLAPFYGEVVSFGEVLGLYRIHRKNHGAMTDLDGRKLRVKLVFDFQRILVLGEFLNSLGIRTWHDWLRDDCAHWKYRLASLCVEPDKHILLDDRKLRLAWQGLGAALRDPFYNLRAKLFHVAWFVMMATLPSPWNRKLARLGILGWRSSRTSSCSSASGPVDSRAVSTNV